MKWLDRFLFFVTCTVIAATLIGCEANSLLLTVQQKVETEAESSQTVATPTFSSSAGTYSSDLSVAIDDSTSGATIYYTLTPGTTGAVPTTSSKKYTEPVVIAGNGTTATIMAIAVKGSMVTSEVATATYVVNYSQVSTPNLSPSAGTYSADTNVTITDSTNGAAIYYTVTAGTTGTTPTRTSTLYSGPISVAGSGTTVTIKAIAVKSGMADSTETTATYVINYNQVSTPSISPSAGTYTADTNVTITDSTNGADIYYTMTAGTTGTTPTRTSTPYSGPISVAGNGTTVTIKAIAVKSGMADSTETTATYVINYNQVSTPSISPSAGTYSSDTNVSITDSTSGAAIYYTKVVGTTGTPATTSSTPYTGPIPVAGDGTTVTIEAIAAKSGMANSDVATATYVVHYPIVTPSGLSFTAVTAGGLTASWSSTGAQSYQLYRSTSASGSYTQVYSGSATSFTESATLMPDAPYYYKIQGTYAAGTSPQSSEASATTLNCLFVLNQSSKTIQTFCMNTDGSLTSSSTLSVSKAPIACVVSPDRSFLYVSDASKLYAYSIGYGGALALVGSYSAGSMPEGIAITVDGTRLYSADYWGQAIYAFTVNTSTGVLTQIGSYSTGSSTYPAEIAITPDGAHLYTTLSYTDLNKVYAFSINSSTGALTAISTYTTGSNPNPIAVSPNGSFLYVENAGGGTFTPFTINSSTGALTSQNTTAMGAYTDEMAITSNSAYLYAASEYQNKVYAFSINSSTGVLTLISTYTLPVAGGVSGSYVCTTALNRDCTRLYVTNNYSNMITSYSIGSGGTLTAIGSYSTGTLPVYIAVH